MRIGLSTSVIQRGQTGIAQHVFALIKEYLRFADRHQFVLYVLEEDLPLFEFAKDAVSLVTVPEHFRPPVRNILWHQTQLPRLARKHQLDVLHVPSYRRLLWSWPCPLVATIHDLAAFRVRGKYDPLRMLYGRYVVKWLVRRQDEIVAISQCTARDIAECFRIRPERIRVIYNGVDRDRFFTGSRDKARQWAAQRHGLNAPFFFYVSRLEHPAKNHVRLVEAFNRFKAETRSDWQLVLAGGDWSGAEIIHQAIRQSPFGAEVRCLGFVPDTELPDLHRAAEVFVYPSLYEGFGLPPIEAMACGCPVLSSARGALEEVVGEAAAVMDPEDTAALTRQLVRLATDAGLRESLRALGLERARHFDWEKSAAATLDVYARAAARPKLSQALSRFFVPGERRVIF